MGSNKNGLRVGGLCFLIVGHMKGHIHEICVYIMLMQCCMMDLHLLIWLTLVLQLRQDAAE